MNSLSKPSPNQLPSPDCDGRLPTFFLRGAVMTETFAERVRKPIRNKYLASSTTGNLTKFDPPSFINRRGGLL